MCAMLGLHVCDGKQSIVKYELINIFLAWYNCSVRIRCYVSDVFCAVVGGNHSG